PTGTRCPSRPASSRNPKNPAWVVLDQPGRSLATPPRAVQIPETRWELQKHRACHDGEPRDTVRSRNGFASALEIGLESVGHIPERADFLGELLAGNHHASQDFFTAFLDGIGRGLDFVER